MNVIVCFLLIRGISSVIGSPSPLTIRDIEEYIGNENINFSGHPEHNLTLLPRKNLMIPDHSLVWKGFYNGKVVAIKIHWHPSSFDREIKILIALNAAEDLNIEQRGIPRVYYHGPFLRNYRAIAMTLFDETLKDRCKPANMPISDAKILMWFRRAVEILKYLNEKRVVHNDIKPANLFLRGAEIFVSDFDLATSNGEQIPGSTAMWASSGYYAKKKRTSMDDLESLVFSMWYVAGVRVGPEPEGSVLCECKKRDTAEARMQNKCNQIDNVIVRKTFQFVCITEILLSKRKIPKYDLIIEVFTGAINVLNGNIEPTQFELILQEAVHSGGSSAFSRIFQIFG